MACTDESRRLERAGEAPRLERRLHPAAVYRRLPDPRDRRAALALVTLLSVAVVGVLFGGLAVILAVPFTSAVATLMDVLVLGHEPPTEQPRRSLRLRRSG